jgi:hypothetical protein
MAETYTYKADHAEDSGNSYSIGVTDGRATTATRVGYFYSDGGSEVGLKQAADAAYTAAGPVHPNNAGLALKGARAARVAPNIVRVELYYNGRQGVNPGKPSAELVRSDSGFVTFKTWHKSVPTTGDPPVSAFDHLGRPNGDRNFVLTGTDFDKERHQPPQPIYFQVPIQVVRLPALLDEDPSPVVLDLLGTLNDDDVNWAGQTRKKGSLQFQRFWVEPVIIDDVVKYRVEYTFAYRRSLWVVELPPVWNIDDGKWVEPSGTAGNGTPINNWYAYIARMADWDDGDAFPQNT